MTDSQDWWPADFGHYGPLFIRMAWHSAGTYRIGDGRGGGGSGSQRFAPLNSWPDNVNLDKARRLLWPIKQKYGRQDLVGRPDDPRRQRRAGVDGLQDLRFRRRARGRLGAGGGHLLGRREASGSATSATRGDRELENPLGAVQMGLIYVNPEGPNGNPDPLAAARDIRETFAPHGDERRGDGRADRRRPHASARPTAPAIRATTSGPSPRRPASRSRASAGRTRFGTGKGGDAITSGLEVTWTTTPTKWSNDFFENLFGYEWELTKSPAGAHQWTPKDGAGAGTVPDAHDPSKRHAPTMLTTDLALRFDPAYEKISRRFLEHPDQFADAFARAWFKLTHRDMGPRARYLGPEVPAEELIWQDPIPAVDHTLIDEKDIAALKAQDPRVGPVDLAAGLDRLGVGVDLPRLRQARRRERRAHPPRAAEGLGGQPAGRAGEGADDARGASRRSSTARSPAARRSRSPT